MGRRLRVVFFGTAEFAVPSLNALRDAGHEVLAVVTQPDKPQGRGRQLAASPVKQAALAQNLPVLQPRRVRAEAFLEKMRALAPDVLALAAFGQIVPQALLDLPPLGPINVHGSLLPKYRGAAPIQRAIMAGETQTGVTTMWMDASLDTGDMLLESAIPILREDTAGTLTPKLAEIGAQLLIQTLDGLAEGTLPRRPQEDAQATPAPALTPDDSLIRWDELASTTENRVRGLSPKPGAFAVFRGQRVKIWEGSAEVLAEEIEADTEAGKTAPGALEAGAPGTILRVEMKGAHGVLVATGGGGALRLRVVQPESRNRMPAESWAQSARIAVGEAFD